MTDVCCFFSAGFCEGARAAASAGPAPSGGTAQDHTAAALVPQHALQEAVPELKASGSNHTGRWWCLISSLITICKSCRCSSGCSWSIWGLKSVPLCYEGACHQSWTPRRLVIWSWERPSWKACIEADALQFPNHSCFKELPAVFAEILA